MSKMLLVEPKAIKMAKEKELKAFYRLAKKILLRKSDRTASVPWKGAETIN